MVDEHREAERMREDVPSTIARSGDKAVRTYRKTLDSAEETYGSGARSRRAAFASLKHTHEKVGDHWEPKDEYGPSDAQAEKQAPESLDHPADTADGVDANASKAHLLEIAKRLAVSGRTRMTKDELVEAIRKANARETRRARG